MLLLLFLYVCFTNNPLFSLLFSPPGLGVHLFVLVALENSLLALTRWGPLKFVLEDIVTVQGVKTTSVAFHKLATSCSFTTQWQQMWKGNILGDSDCYFVNMFVAQSTPDRNNSSSVLAPGRQYFCPTLLMELGPSLFHINFNRGRFGCVNFS